MHIKYSFCKRSGGWQYVTHERAEIFM